MDYLMHDALDAAAERRPGHLAIVAGEGRLSYAVLWDHAARFAQVLVARGLRRGDRVLVLMDNVPECAVALFASWMADTVVVPVNPLTKAEKLAWILRDCGARAIVTESHHAPTALAAVAAVGPCPVFVAGPVADVPAGTLSMSAELHAVPATLPLRRNIGPDLAAILYTSGTTGEPKGVMHTHDSLRFTRESVVSYLRLTAADRIFNALPLSFGYGLFQLLPSIAVGATLVLERNFAYPAQAFARMQAEAVTTFAGVPTVFAMMIAQAERQPLRFPSVRIVTNAAAALPSRFVPGLRGVFPNAGLVPMYGQTECIRACYLPPAMVDANPDTVGFAIPGTEALILDDDGRPVVDGEVGTLHIRGPNVMRGYWQDPVRTAQALVPGPVPGEVMLRTGDRFRRDAAGLLQFVARQDEIIKSRGEKVSPAEVERAVYRLPAVAEVLVCGVPDPILGEAVGALVVRRAGAELADRDIKRVCAEHLEAYMVPKHVRFVDSLPRTQNGKASRVMAAQEFADEPAATGSIS